MTENMGETLLKETVSFERVDFSEETGFMGKVEKELGYLYDFLQSTNYLDKDIGCKRLFRLLIFIDDLDRCKAAKIMKMLQATILLLGDAPVTCYLAIDSRIVVASIEAENKEVFKRQNINGHEFLDKIVQFPFCLPELDKATKEKFLRKIIGAKSMEPINLLNEIQRTTRKILKMMYPEISTPEYVEFGKIDQLIDHKKANKFSNLLDCANMLSDSFVVDDKSSLANVLLLVEGSTSKKSLRPEFYEEFEFQILKVLYSLEDKYINKDDAKDKAIDKDTPEGNYVISDKDSSKIIPKLGADVEVSPNVQKAEDKNQTPDADLHHAVKNAENLNTTADDQDLPTSFTQIIEDNDRDRALPMLNDGERKKLSEYSVCVDSNPRRMKRIINVYNFCKYIVEKEHTGMVEKKLTEFKYKLLKFVILLEQWPYRMAWVMQTIEDAKQVNDFDQKFKGNKGSIRQGNYASVAKQMLGLFQRLYRQQENISGNQALEESHNDVLQDIYRKLSVHSIDNAIVQRLVYSSSDYKYNLARDSDPQLFEHLLLMEPVIMLGDIISADDETESSLNLGNYAFNIQKSTCDIVSREIDEIVLIEERNKKEGEDKSFANNVNESRIDWISFARKADLFDGMKGQMNSCVD